MRFFLRSDPKCDQRFAILLREMELPQFQLEEQLWNVWEMDRLLKQAILFQKRVARHEIYQHPAIAWMEASGTLVHCLPYKQHRVSAFEAQANHLLAQELLVGLSFTIIDRGKAAAFKLAWGNNASPDLIAYQAKPVARQSLAFAA
mgnify:FL=1